MRLYGKTRFDRSHRCIGFHFGCIEIPIFAPDQFRLLALLDNGLEETPKHTQTITGADLTQRRMIREWLIQIVPDIPPHAQSISHLAHEQALRTDVLEEHNKLELKKDDRINGCSSGNRVVLAHQIVNE